MTACDFFFPLGFEILNLTVFEWSYYQKASDYFLDNHFLSPTENDHMHL